MRYEIRGSNSVRACTISECKVKLPSVSTCGHNKQYAEPGDLVVYNESAPGDTWFPQFGRVLGRVDAPFVAGATSPKYDCPKVEGWLAVLVLSHSTSSAYVRWVRPERVTECRPVPTALAAWFFQLKLPDPVTCIRLADHGTLSESYIADPRCGPAELREDDKDHRSFLMLKTQE